MTEPTNTPGASKVAVATLALVGLANWAYAGYRMMNGKPDTAALFIAGVAALTIALILHQRR